MAAISQTIFPDAFFWMKSFVFWLKFHWSVFLRVQLTISQRWFRWWLGADQATSHYLNQCWPSSLTHICSTRGRWVNTLRLRQNVCHFAHDSFKCTFQNENCCILFQISLRFVPNGPINKVSTLVQIMPCHRPGNKPLSDPMMARLPMHVCVIRP